MKIENPRFSFIGYFSLKSQVFQIYYEKGHNINIGNIGNFTIF